MIQNQKFLNYFYKIIIVLLLLILIIFSLLNKKKSESFKSFKTYITKKYKSNRKPIINNYKLYNASDNSFLTLILNFSDTNMIFMNNTLINYIRDLSKQIIQDIQIIVLNESSSGIMHNKSIKFYFKRRKIETLSFHVKEWKKDFFDLMHLIKGKFFILIDKAIKFDKNFFNNIFNIAKGNTKNIFTIKYQNKEIIYVIKTKSLKDIFDEEKEFHNFKDIINSINTSSSSQINVIPIAFCPNNYYTSLTYTSMISILISKAYYTFILFYLIVPMDFSDENIRLIESLYEQFDFFNISFIKLDNRYENAFINRYLTKNAYFRFSLAELLPNLNKIIYLDSDTIILKDLSKLYNLNFNGKIFIARVINYKKGNLNFEINSGVLLLNLIGMRRMKIEKTVITLLNKGFKDSFHDQAIINIFFKKYVGFLPPEYNSLTFNYETVKKRKKKYGNLYDFDSLYFSFKFPYIIHYAGILKFKTYNHEDWYYFARKSKYFHKRTHNYSDIFKYISYPM